VVRIAQGELRLGLGDQTILEATPKASFDDQIQHYTTAKVTFVLTGRKYDQRLVEQRQSLTTLNRSRGSSP
jgi:hypothetical protein